VENIFRFLYLFLFHFRFILVFFIWPFLRDIIFRGCRSHLPQRKEGMLFYITRFCRFLLDFVSVFLSHFHTLISFLQSYQTGFCDVCAFYFRGSLPLIALPCYSFAFSLSIAHFRASFVPIGSFSLFNTSLIF